VDRLELTVENRDDADVDLMLPGSHQPQLYQELLGEVRTCLRYSNSVSYGRMSTGAGRDMIRHVIKAGSLKGTAGWTARRCSRLAPHGGTDRRTRGSGRQTRGDRSGLELVRSTDGIKAAEESWCKQ
jgi:hypothetical protein